MLTFNVNWLAVIVAAFANMVTGALWYGPLFGKPWMQELGLTMEDIEGGDMAKPYAVAILNSLLMAFVLANAIAWTGAATIGTGVLLALVLWVGFTGFTFAVNHAFEGRSTRLWLINSGTFLAGLVVMSIILTLWR
jgi:hypothetical protein